MNAVEDAKPTLTRNFAATTSAAYRRAAGNPGALTALDSIERRTAAIKQRAIAHYGKFQDRWVAKETIRLWQRQLERNAQNPGPNGVIPTVTAEMLSKTASWNVKARTNARLTRIAAIQRRMQNTVVRNLEPAKLSPQFQAVARKNPQTPTKKMTRHQ